MNYKWFFMFALVVCSVSCAAAGGADTDVAADTGAGRAADAGPNALATPGARAGGWLGRVVQYRRERFFDDVHRVLPPVYITARIERAPAGYVDAAGWDRASAARLLALLRASPAGRPVYRALRRSLGPTRRILLTKKDTYKYFPSIHADNYYDDSYESSEEADDPLSPVSPPKWPIDDNSVVIVSNAVEARLPSARISVRMLREIMEARAEAARIMPTTAASSIKWTTKEGSTPKPGEVTNDTSVTNETVTSSPEGTDINATEEVTPEGGGDDATEAEGNEGGTEETETKEPDEPAPEEPEEPEEPA